MITLYAAFGSNEFVPSLDCHIIQCHLDRKWLEREFKSNWYGMKDNCVAPFKEYAGPEILSKHILMENSVPVMLRAMEDYLLFENHSVYDPRGLIEDFRKLWARNNEYDGVQLIDGRILYFLESITD